MPEPYRSHDWTLVPAKPGLQGWILMSEWICIVIRNPGLSTSLICATLCPADTIISTIKCIALLCSRYSLYQHRLLLPSRCLWFRYCSFTFYWLFVSFFFKSPSQNCAKRLISFVMSVRPSVLMQQLSYHWTDIHEIWFWMFSENVSRKFKCHWNLTILTGTLQADRYTVYHISLGSS